MTVIDTAVWIALLRTNDSTNQKAKEIAKNISIEDLMVYDHIFIETLTVLRNKVSESACHKFMKFLSEINKKVLISNEKMLSLANLLFFQFKKLSFTDCLLLASAKVNHAQLITLDQELQKAWASINK